MLPNGSDWAVTLEGLRKALQNVTVVLTLVVMVLRFIAQLGQNGEE